MTQQVYAATGLAPDTEYYAHFVQVNESRNQLTSNVVTSAKFRTMVATGDTTPDPFTFTDLTNQPTDTLVESNSIIVSGVDAATNIPVSIAGGGAYKIDSGEYTTDPGVVQLGQNVTLSLYTSTEDSTTSSATLTIGGVSDTWTVQTTIVAHPPVLIDPIPNQIGKQGVAITPIVLTDHFEGANSFATTALPAGITFSADTISGTPTAGSTLSTDVTATNADGDTHDSFDWDIEALVAPVQTAPYPDRSVYFTASVNYQFGDPYWSSNGSAMTYAADQLPAGLSMNSAGFVTGIPNTEQVMATVITATNSIGSTAGNAFNWTVHAELPEGGGEQPRLGLGIYIGI